MAERWGRVTGMSEGDIGDSKLTVLKLSL